MNAFLHRNLIMTFSYGCHSGILCGYLARFLSPGSKNRKKSTPKKFLIIREMELSDSKIKKFLIFSQKKAFLMFLEMEPCTF